MWCGNEKVQVKCSSFQLSRTAHGGWVGGSFYWWGALGFGSQWTHSACHSAPTSRPSPGDTVLAEAAQALYLAPNMVFPLFTFPTDALCFSDINDLSFHSRALESTIFQNPIYLSLPACYTQRKTQPTATTTTPQLTFA